MRLLIILVNILAVQSLRGAIKPPHIIYILVDDMGWNDVSFHGSDQIPTPNIDSIAYHGVVLNRHYAQPVCTPTRASLMTGKYPLHTGLHTPLSASHRVGLDLSEKILPQYLKDLTYSTYLIGKWHLGFYERGFTPLNRGFDYHFGYWSGAISYYDHIDKNEALVPPFNYSFSGHDLRRGYTSAWDVVGKYATDVFTEESIKVIENHSPNNPMFLLISHLGVHAGNDGKWLEAPQEVINRFSYISDPNRRTYAAMVSKIDESVGAIVKALNDNDMLKNSVIVFASDNGAPSEGLYNNWGSNYPWRGQKDTLWEGGVRTPAIIWSPLIKKPSRVSYDLMHITDWLPTFLAIADCKTRNLEIDGVNQWMMISEDISTRDELVVEIDEEKNRTSLVLEKYKYLKGPLNTNADRKYNTFLNLHSIISPNAPVYSVERLLDSPAWQALDTFSKDPELASKVFQLRQQATVVCQHDFDTVLNCTNNPCLFDTSIDPCEQNNIASSSPEVVNTILDKIDGYRSSAVPDATLILDPNSNPEYYNGTWSIWVS